jgi:peptidoglycan/xylan/chitin deacetylase (PgdA/CDA1 family)
MLKLRPDRFATLYLSHPMLRRVPLRRRVRIPILMYHSIRKAGVQDTHPYYETETSVLMFQEQMAFLHENGFSVISLSEAVRLLDAGARPSDNRVVITFDDGFEDFYTDALPILNRYRFTATVFLPTAFISCTPIEFKNKACLTWAQVREAHRAGIGFGSHTVTHPQLKEVSTYELEYEIRYSKETIEDQLGDRVDSFSYPYAFPEEDAEFKQALQRTLATYEYKSGVSTRIGTAGADDDRFFMKRLPVNSYDDLPLFKAKLEGGYDWLHSLQYASKWIHAKLA